MATPLLTMFVVFMALSYLRGRSLRRQQERRAIRRMAAEALAHGEWRQL